MRQVVHRVARRGALGLIGVGVLGVVAVVATADAWAPGMIVLAPSPAYAPRAAPRDPATAIEVERAGARVRAWVFEPQSSCRGTAVLLHGIRSSKQSQLGWARGLATRGLRAMVVDSRGHGESSGRYLTYGVEEARDLRALLDELARHDALTRPLAILGSSYGAATAIQHAAIDRRVDAVVAIAPFSSLREVVPAYVRWIAGPAAMLVPRFWLDARLDEVGRLAGFDPDAACPRCLAPSVRAPVLLVHSRDDERIPWAQSVRIREALRSPSELMLVDGAPHVGTGGAPGVRDRIDRWLDRQLGDEAPQRRRPGGVPGRQSPKE